MPEFPNLLVTRTLSKAHSLAGFRVGYGVFPAAVADDLNGHNDAYPLARASQAAAIATLQHEDKIRARAERLHAGTEALAAELRALGVRTHPTRTYFLADFAPHAAKRIAARRRSLDILIQPLNHPALGPGYMRVTTARPEAAYVSELLALRPFVPWAGYGIGIEVVSGRFAAPLGIQVGGPSSAMLCVQLRLG